MLDFDLLERVFVERVESLKVLVEVNNTPTQMPIDNTPSCSVWFGGAPPVPGQYETTKALARAPRRVTVHTLLFLPDFYYQDGKSQKLKVLQVVATALNGWQPPCTGCTQSAVVNPYWDGFEDSEVINYMVQAVIDVFPENFRRNNCSEEVFL